MNTIKLNIFVEVCVWWAVGGHEVYPWSPELRDEDRANMALISLRDDTVPHIVGYHRTSNDPVYFRFLSDTNNLHYLAQVDMTYMFLTSALIFFYYRPLKQLGEVRQSWKIQSSQLIMKSISRKRCQDQ